MLAQKTIWHVGGWNRNYGDFAIQVGLSRLFHSLSKAPLRFVPIDCQRTWFHPALIDRLNAEADLLLVGGGGMVFHRPEDDSHSGWQFNISEADLERVRVPLAVYGIGFNRFPYDASEFKSQTNAHLRKTQEKSIAFSTRNTGTRDELVSRGLAVDAIDIVPDAALFADAAPIELPIAGVSGPVIVLNWAGNRVGQLWPAPAEKTALGFAADLAEALASVVEDRDGRVLWTPHLADVDSHLRHIFSRRLCERFVDMEAACRRIYPPSAYQLPFLAEVYARSDLAVGMRGHANIIPFGQGTKVVAIGGHSKNRFF